MGIDSQSTDVAVRNLSGVFALIQKPQVAALYTHLRAQPRTVPDVLSELDIGKTAAYDYTELLQSAGLLSVVGTEGRSTVYRANDFEITLQIADDEISVTPDLVRLLGARTENQALTDFVDQYGVAMLARFVDLAEQYAEGSTTYRSIAHVLDIPRGTAFDTLEAVLTVLDMVPDSAHSQPGDRSDADVAALIEDARDAEN